jgi:hypothetical protein
LLFYRSEVAMEIHEGFIVGIFNYCDRWCEACVFTSRCRLFADVAEIEASLDPGLKPVVDAPALPSESPPLPPWMEKMIHEVNTATAPVVAVEDVRPRPTSSAEHLTIGMRARRYCARVYPWLQSRSATKGPDDPAAVIEWFHTMIPVKIQRAILGFAEDGPDERNWPPDYDGSAKVALIGIERSHAAWLDLVERGDLTQCEAEPFIADLVWLGDAVEQAFPRARAFVRPAFDEPEEVAQLLAREGRVG